MDARETYYTSLSWTGSSSCTCPLRSSIRIFFQVELVEFFATFVKRSQVKAASTASLVTRALPRRRLVLVLGKGLSGIVHEEKKQRTPERTANNDKSSRCAVGAS